ncbi:hypothetical protein COO03_04755 [Bacillus sp. AFS098217]|uniref:thermonuclease family protein n=1 Tax=Bacillus sp. AFS098217 TaxID=2033868 RepID=UPI000BED16E0|nr:thermonuclease family protein [Bacillus sp. AFS098217]PEB54554.1 hypothetical protein COO03_04755 [Bacillus sp. AFS098217]
MKVLTKVVVITSCILTLAACSTSTNTKNSQPDQKPENGTQQADIQKNSVDVPTEYKAKLEGLEIVKGHVTHVKDGDTVDVQVNDPKQPMRILPTRLLLLNTPESVSKKIPPQQMSKEASAFLKQRIEGKDVTLVYDKGPKEDKYGRKLAYVFCEGEHINELMVKLGYGIVAYITKPNTTLLPEMLEAEKQAKLSKNGVWSIKGYVDEKSRHYNRNDAA